MASTSWRGYHYSQWSGSSNAEVMARYIPLQYTFFSSSSCGNTDQYSSTWEFCSKIFICNKQQQKSLKHALSLQFRRKCTNKLLPLGHLWQQAILCQLLLKTIHITAPKISLKITIFFILVTGCQFWKCQWETGLVTTVNSRHYFNTRTADPWRVCGLAIFIWCLSGQTRKIIAVY